MRIVLRIRAIDDCTASGINPCTPPSVKLRVDGIDPFVVAIRKRCDVAIDLPHLFKADIDAAYRRIPLAPEHRWAAAVAVKVMAMHS